VNRTKAVAHRVGQARRLALRAELALTLTQILLWVSLIGGVAVALLWLRRRASPTEQATPAPASPIADGSSGN
jgi:hypothetical protein